MKRIASITLMLVMLGSTPVVAGEACDCCEHCGCHHSCCKVCRCVPEVKKVPKTTYSCECEDFCVPGPSHRETVCDECGHRKHVYTPTCATMRTRKKLVKHETVTEKVTYKWVVENLCPCCAAKLQADADTGDVAAQPMPRHFPAQQVGFDADAPSDPAAAAPSRPSPLDDLKSRVGRLFNAAGDADRSVR